MLKVGNACKILDFDIVNIPGGDDEKDRAGRLQTAFVELNKNHRFGSDPVCIAVTGNICLCREFQLPAGSDDNPAKLNDLVQYEAKQQIPFPLDQVEWGYERYEDQAGIGVSLVAVRKHDIQELLNLTDSFKMNVKIITTAPMALFNFINYEFKPEETTLILDAGARGTDFVVMNKRQMYSRTIQIGGREITRVLESKFKVSYEKAEELKKNIAQSQQMSKILAVIEPTLRQLGVEVQRTIGFYKSRARGQRISKCFLLGHTFRLPKMAEYLQGQVREAPFAIVEGLQRIKLDESCNADTWEHEFPTMPVAIGLGLQGLELGELNLNLLPTERKSSTQNVISKVWLAAAAALVVFTLGLLYNQDKRVLNYINEQKDNFTKLETDCTKFQKEEEVIAKAAPPRKALLERLVRVAHDRGKISRVLSAIINLQTEQGKPFFGPVYSADGKVIEKQVYLTNLYASWLPPQDIASDVANNTSRKTDFEQSVFLKKPAGVYGPWLDSVQKNLSKPAEERPEPPLVVIATCEVSPPEELLLVGQEMETALKNIRDVYRDSKGDFHFGFDVVMGSSKQSYTDLLINYDEDKKLKINTDPNGSTSRNGVPYQYATFHAIFRWDDQTDEEPGTAAGTAEAKASGR
jgi:type IV pilus assembly protein PilM